MQGLQKISEPRKRLAELVYDQIFAGLQSGDIRPEDKLHQERLAEMLSVSRTPVREALLRLEQEGLLISTSNGGFEIRQISSADVHNIYQTRQAIEGFCAGYLAQQSDRKILKKLRDSVSKQERKNVETSQDYYEVNRNIHRAFVEATGNSYLIESFDALWNRSLSLHIFQTMDKSLLAASLDGHMPLCDELESGSFEQAQKAMQQHIADGCSLQLKAL